MLPSQKAAVDLNMVELVAAVEWTAPAVLSYFLTRGILSKSEVDMLDSKAISADRLTNLFHILKSKDSGWSNLLSYLTSNNHSFLAENLLKDADRKAVERGPKPKLMPKPRLNRNRSALEEFSLRLAKYYQQNYADLPTMGQSAKHVKDVWVPLWIDGRSEDHLKVDRIDHKELLNRLKSDEHRNVALIKGDPGMGKTTLVKKLAYDWAVNYVSSVDQQFRLVLAVPLRYAGISDRFDRLAIDYFLRILEIDANILKELIGEINQLNSHLLVILDGLDEYANYSKSPFINMFAAPFQQSLAYRNVPPPITTFKLIITSRPYACERINDEYFPLRFVILQLDGQHLYDFVRLYCQTSQGIAKVTEYLKVNAQLVIQVPLILTFICYLADCEDEIPTNMTSLYVNLIRQMIRRENRKEKLAELVNMQKWKDSNLVRTVGEFAFREITEGSSGNFEFTIDSLQRSHVTNDSFICGFLLHKFDFAKDLLMAEFPHRSIQEFFAALHCYQLMLTGCKDELRDISKLIRMDDSQFGRFLFGICSHDGKFFEMRNWLSPSLGDSVDFLWSLADEINQFGTSLIDCSAEENSLMGKRLLESIGRLQERLTGQIHMRLYRALLTLRLNNLSAEFKDSLHLVDLTRDLSGYSHDWSLADNRQSARLAVICDKLPELIEEKFDRIDILIWNTSVDRTSGMKWKTLLSQIRSLPPVRIFIMSTTPRLANTSVFVRIGYGRTTGSELTNFRFEYDREELLETVPDEKVKLRENKREKKINSDGRSFIDINVTVDSCESQSALIYSLIRLSLLSPVQSSANRCVCI